MPSGEQGAIGGKKTITITDEGVLKRMGMGNKKAESVSLSNLKECDILKIVYKLEAKDLIQSVEVMGGGMEDKSQPKQNNSN